MLILSRRIYGGSNEINITHLGEKLRIVLVGLEGNTVRIGFDGPKSFDIQRDELKKHLPLDNEHY